MLNVPRPAKFLGFYPEENLAQRFERVRAQIYGPAIPGKKNIGKTQLLGRAVTEMLDRIERRVPRKSREDVGTLMLAKQLAQLSVPVQSVLRDLLDGLTLLQAKRGRARGLHRSKGPSTSRVAGSRGTGSVTGSHVKGSARGRE